jgi:membrane protein DedA with SNARE-associated domain
MASMFDKIPQKDRKKFVLSAFVYMPISFIISLFFGYLIGKFVGYEFTAFKVLFVSITLSVCFFIAIFNYYKSLTSHST